jgi:hypothetical protein
MDRGYTHPTGKGKKGSALTPTGQELGINTETVRHRLEYAEKRYGITPENVGLEPQIVVDERDCPIEILERIQQQNETYITKRRLKPAVFMVPKQPFAVAIIGDPHLSSAGCNIKALREDLDLLQATNTRAINVGDLLDNFWATSKLAEKEADNHVTRKESLRLAEWFVCDSGVKFDGHILGNHDMWLGPAGVNLMDAWAARAKSRVFDWNARFIYKWDDGQHTLAVSHDFKGHSQYNPTHGPAKMALWDGTADTYVAGHRHNHADAKIPNGWRGRTYQLVRVRGYKDRDTFSEGRPQYAPLDMMEGRSALIVINPLSRTEDGKQRVFMDFDEGIEHLQMLKRRHE